MRWHTHGPGSTRPGAFRAPAGVVVCLCFLSGSSSFAAPPPSPAVSAVDTLRLSLVACEERAQAEGEEAKQAEATREFAWASYVQARSSLLPQLNLSTVYTRQAESALRRQGGIPPFAPDTTASLDQRVHDLEDALPGSGFYALDQLFASSAFAGQNAWGVVLSLEQKLFQGGSLWGSVAAAKHALHASELNQADARDEIAYRVRLAYLDVLLAERTVRIFELGLDQAENHLQQVRLRQEAGSASQFDLLQAEVQRDNQVPPLSRARESRELALLALQRLCNLPSAGPIVLTDPLLGDDAVPDLPLRVDTLGVTGDALRASSIQTLEQVLEARSHAITVAAGDRYPELSLFASVSQLAYPQDVFPDQADWIREKNFGLRLNWALFDGFLTKGAIREAHAERDRALNNLADGRERLVEAVTQARLELERAAAELHARSRTVRLSARSLELANLRYEEGGSSLLEVSDVRIAWQIAQAFEAQARRDYFAALALLERTSGRPLFRTVSGLGDPR